MGRPVHVTDHRGRLGEYRGADRQSSRKPPTPMSTPRWPPPGGPSTTRRAGGAGIRSTEPPASSALPMPSTQRAPMRWHNAFRRRTGCRSPSRPVRGRVPAGPAALLRRTDPRDAALEDIRPGCSAARSWSPVRRSAWSARSCRGTSRRPLPRSSYAPALAAGCTLVIKPSPETVLDSQPARGGGARGRLPARRDQHRAGRAGDRAYLVEHPRVDKVAFTGSTAAGRSIAETLRPAAASGHAGTRRQVRRDRARRRRPGRASGEPVRRHPAQQRPDLLPGHPGPRAARRATTRSSTPSPLSRALTVGDALDESTQIGPMASAAAAGPGRGLHRQGQGRGRPAHRRRWPAAGQDRGWFVEPTVFADVDNGPTIAQEEIFGPVLSVIPYTDDDDAVRIANDSDFGLGGRCGPGSATRRGVARAGADRHHRHQPLPARPGRAVRRRQGFRPGRELGPEGLTAYQSLKSTYLQQ